MKSGSANLSLSIRLARHHLLTNRLENSRSISLLSRSGISCDHTNREIAREASRNDDGTQQENGLGNLSSPEVVRSFIAHQGPLGSSERLCPSTFNCSTPFSHRISSRYFSKSSASYSPDSISGHSNNEHHHHHPYYQPRSGARLLLDNAITKGLAFTEQERESLNILGLLPPAHRNQDLQVQAALNFVNNIGDNLTKYIYLRNLKDYNERMFYKTLAENVEALMPIVYTPVVGLACQNFSHIYLRPRGLYVTINDLGRVSKVVSNWPFDSVHATVVTDGERILGLGDLGANGMGISIGKLSLYTALAGIPPHTVLPVCLDVGTNNQALLNDPFYIGLRHERVSGDKYFQLLDEFMEAVVNRFGRSCLIQFEDFANSNAFTILEKYRGRYCTFNDDIQGTASVCLSGLMSAARLASGTLKDQTFLFFGAGEANLGSASLLTEALIDEGMTRDEAVEKIWMMDLDGLVVESRDQTNFNGHKKAMMRKGPMLTDFHEILDFVRPTALIGASAATGAFTGDVLKKMTTFCERPIIFALSNPTSKAECTAAQAYQHTRGRCIFASGSPFEPVEFNGKTYTTGQGNNSYIFPGIALAVMAAQAPIVPDKTFIIASRALSDQVQDSELEAGLVYPRIGRIREVTLHVASKVMEYFYSEGLTNYHFEPKDKLAFLKDIQYDYDYDSSLKNASSSRK